MSSFSSIRGYLGHSNLSSWSSFELPMSDLDYTNRQLHTPESTYNSEDCLYELPMYSNENNLYDHQYCDNDYEGSISFGYGPASLSQSKSVSSPSFESFRKTARSTTISGFYSPAPTILDSGDEYSSSQIPLGQYVSLI